MNIQASGLIITILIFVGSLQSGPWHLQGLSPCSSIFQTFLPFSQTRDPAQVLPRSPYSRLDIWGPPHSMPGVDAAILLLLEQKVHRPDQKRKSSKIRLSTLNFAHVAWSFKVTEPSRVPFDAPRNPTRSTNDYASTKAGHFEGSCSLTDSFSSAMSVSCRLTRGKHRQSPEHCVIPMSWHINRGWSIG